MIGVAEWRGECGGAKRSGAGRGRSAPSTQNRQRRCLSSVFAKLVPNGFHALSRARSAAARARPPVLGHSGRRRRHRAAEGGRRGATARRRHVDTDVACFASSITRCITCPRGFVDDFSRLSESLRVPPCRAGRGGARGSQRIAPRRRADTTVLPLPALKRVHCSVVTCQASRRPSFTQTVPSPRP